MFLQIGDCFGRFEGQRLPLDLAVGCTRANSGQATHGRSPDQSIGCEICMWDEAAVSQSGYTGDLARQSAGTCITVLGPIDYAAAACQSRAVVRCENWRAMTSFITVVIMNDGSTRYCGMKY